MFGWTEWTGYFVTPTPIGSYFVPDWVIYCSKRRGVDSTANEMQHLPTQSESTHDRTKTTYSHNHGQQWQRID